MTQKAYAAGSTLPPLKGDTLRLYSMRFCPFAQRTRLVLAHLNVPHEVVNVNLKVKPEWLLEKNPLGLVPVLEQGNKIIYESAICDEYLDEVYGKHALMTTDPYEKARQKILMERFSKVVSSFFTIMRQSGDEQKKLVDDVQKALDVFEESLAAHFFGGKSVKMVDYHIWPWFERFQTLEKVAGIDLLPTKRYPKLSAWVGRMMELSAVKTALVTTDLHYKFLYEGYITGSMPDYDVGLD